jgi:predicted membrane protein
VLAEAGKRGIKVMLVLVNFWKAYGGMSQYVKCVSAKSSLLPARFLLHLLLMMGTSVPEKS